MKVFVYSKKDSKKVDQIDNAVSVKVEYGEIHIFTTDNLTITFYTNEVKTTIYQN